MVEDEAVEADEEPAAGFDPVDVAAVEVDVDVAVAVDVEVEVSVSVDVEVFVAVDVDVEVDVDPLLVGPSVGGVAVRVTPAVRDGAAGERETLGRFEPPPHEARTSTMATTPSEGPPAIRHFLAELSAPVRLPPWPPTSRSG